MTGPAARETRGVERFTGIRLERRNLSRKKRGEGMAGAGKQSQRDW